MNCSAFVPHVSHDSSNGIALFQIPDDMLEYRELSIVGDIDQAGAYAICQVIRHLDRIDPDAPITIFIDSYGGEVNAGLAIYDSMRTASCPVNTVCVGVAASMGAVLFVAGDERSMYPHSELMIHDPLTVGGGGSALTVQEQSRRLMQTREVTASILAKHSGISLDEIYSMTSKDTWLSAKKAIEMGFADGIVRPVKDEA